MKVTSLDIVCEPKNTNRIKPILKEIEHIWLNHPELTFSKLLGKIVESEYIRGYLVAITDDELVNAIINYKKETL